MDTTNLPAAAPVSRYSGQLPLLTAGLCTPGTYVLGMNAHGILRALRISKYNLMTLHLEDGTRYRWNPKAGAFISQASKGKVLTVYAMPSDLTPELVNAEYAKWYAKQKALETDRQARADTAKNITTLARRIAGSLLVDRPIDTLKAIEADLQQIADRCQA